MCVYTSFLPLEYSLTTRLKFYSNYPEALAIPNDPSTRGEHFLEEAMRHLAMEDDRLRLTTLQAWGDIYTMYDETDAF
jgi:hypothetical protein